MNTTYFLNTVAGNVYGTKATPPLPANYYIGLSETEPTISGANVKEPSPSGTSYERVLLNTLSAPTNGLITNTLPVEFNKSTATWGKVSYWVIYDAKTGGNLLSYSTILDGDGMPVTFDIRTGSSVNVDAGSIKLSTTNPIQESSR